MVAPFTILRPKSLADVTDMLASEPDLQPVAGATALQLDWRRGVPMPTRLLDLSGVLDFKLIEVNADDLCLGAVLQLDTLEHPFRFFKRWPAPREERWPIFPDMVRTIASPAIRARGTIGGNVAGGTGCLIPMLLALDAKVDVLIGGFLHATPLETWLARPRTAPSLLATILIPPIPDGSRIYHRKFGLRAAFSPSIIGVAARITTDDDGSIKAARFAVGGGAVRPQRLRHAETWIVGAKLADLDRAGLQAAPAAEIEAPTDAFRTAAYRKAVASRALVSGLVDGVATRERANRPVPVTTALSRESFGSRWRIRPDMADKIAGRLLYLTDQRAPDMLVGRILRAGRPHARILSIDTSAAEALAGVVVVTAKDIAGLNGYGIVVQDQPALCTDTVRYVGDAVAAVAAPDADTAARALALIAVTYEPLPIVDDPEAALAPDAPKIHPAGNLQSIQDFSRGDIEAARARCVHIVEDTYVTPRQMHGFMETEGGFAQLEEDGTLTVCVGGQHGARDRMQLSRILGLPEDRIRVVTSPTGGAFGGKDELTVQPALALLALKAKRPVRLQLDRTESVAAGWKRNPMRIVMRTGCDADGRLLLQEVDLLADCGAYASLSPAVIETALEHSCGPYVIPNVATRGRLVYTNNGICGAFRGFGANQMTYAIECQIGRLAEKVGLDPIAIRRLNLRVPRSPGYFGHAVAPHEKLVEMLDAADASDLWDRPRHDGDDTMAIGVGMALNLQGNGLGSLVPDQGAGRLSLRADGRIEAAFGLDEIGQGLLAIIQATVADALGCDRDDIAPLTGDTGRTPDSGSTTASRGTYVVWQVAQTAGADLRRQLCEAAGHALARAPEDLAIIPGGFRDIRSNSGAAVLTFADLAQSLSPAERPHASATFEFPKADYAEGNARFVFAFGATLARVAVDTISGTITVLDLDQHVAAGPILDPASFIGQIEGGGVQGLGFTLSEDAIMDKGRYVTANLDTYMMPGLADAPARMRVFALEALDADDPHGPRGIGEIGIGAVTPAIAAAVADAIGYWPATTPFQPEQILAAMDKGGTA